MNPSPLLDTLRPRRIAVFRALQLGDMLCAVPALEALRAAAPTAHITLIGLPWATTFAARYRHLIDEWVHFPGAPGFPEQAEDGAGLPAFFAQMRARRFDLAIQLHGSGGPANDLLLQLGARAYAGFVQPGERASRPADGIFIDWPDALPEPLRYTALTDALGAPAREPRLDFPLTDADRREYAWLERAEGIEPQRLVVVHPGAQLPSRRWPATRFAAVADALAGDGWQIAITGTAAEAPLTASVLGEMAAPALHLGGTTSLGALGALISRARLVVCNDTGLSHVAAALRTPSVVIASGSDTRRWAPLDRERHTVLADHPPCRPCAFRDCPYGHVCALNVSVEAVAQAARAQLARRLDCAAAAPFTLHATAATAAPGSYHHAA